MKKILIALLLSAIAGFAYYAISPLFDVQEVNDAAPEALILPASEPDDSDLALVPDGSGFDNLLESDQLKMLAQMDDMNTVVAEPMDDKMEGEVQGEGNDVIGTLGHPASGMARVINTAEGQVIRFEDFETINGPNLHLYLSKDLEGEDFIDLGSIKGTVGNINYLVPKGIDLAEYKYVMHWCVPFGVLFNYVEIE
jgi:hypothetical protein